MVTTQAWTQLECSICDPRAGITSKTKVCAHQCDAIYRACKDDYFTEDKLQRPLKKKAQTGFSLPVLVLAIAIGASSCAITLLGAPPIWPAPPLWREPRR